MVICDWNLSPLLWYVSLLHSFLLLNNILLYRYIIFCLCVYQLISISLPFFLIMNNVDMKIGAQVFFVRKYVSFLLGSYLRVELLGHMVTLCWIVWVNIKWFFKVAASFYISIYIRVSNFSMFSPTFVIVWFFLNHSYSGKCEWCLIGLFLCIMHLICITDKAKQLFIFHWSFVYPLWKCLIFFFLKIRLFVFLLLSCNSSLYSMATSPLSNKHDLQIVIPSLWVFHFLHDILWCTNAFKYQWSSK